MNDPTKWGAEMSALWKTPDGSIITEASTTPRGRIVVRTDSGKTYIVPKRCTNRLLTKDGYVPLTAPRGSPKTIRIKLPTKNSAETK